MTFRLSFGDTFPVVAAHSSLCFSWCRGTSFHTVRYELPLVGFPKIAPLPYEARCVLSKLTSRRWWALGARLPSLTHGPPSSFFTTSAVFSASRPAGLLHPAAGCGVRHVSGFCLWSSPVQAPVVTFDSTLSQWRLTLRSLPLDNSPSHVTATRFPLAVPARFVPLRSTQAPCSDSLCVPANLRALLRCRVRCSPQTLPPVCCPILPWA